MSSIEQQIIETPLNVPINPIVQLELERESMMVVEPVAMPIPPVAPNTVLHHFMFLCFNYYFLFIYSSWF